MSSSELYPACRIGDLETVRRLLGTLPLDTLNHIEPNGSTSLHVACRHGHIDVVRLLLEKGAQRRLLNKFNLTPVDEAPTDEIKELFNREPIGTTERFVGQTPQIEWTKAGRHSAYTAFANWDDPVEFEDIGTALNEISNAPELRDAAGMDQIRSFLQKAVETQDYTYFVRAYTAETDLYKRLNRLHAQINLGYTEADRNKWFIKFSTGLKNSWHLRKYWWTGMCCRGLHMTDSDLAEYKVGEMITNKAFMSTSKNSEIAVRFASKIVPGMQAVLCVYSIHRLEIAMDISTISEYPKEQEVLIFPNIPFKIIDVTPGDPVMMALSA